MLTVMGVMPMEKEELFVYQLKDIALIWFNQWKERHMKCLIIHST